MKKAYLYGHTGSTNRGCEAIVRSTVKILNDCGIRDIRLYSYAKSDDVAKGLNEDVVIYEYPKKSIWTKGISFIQKKFFKDALWGYKKTTKRILPFDDKDIILFNIGGDTYCYGIPYGSYALNEVAEERRLRTIFWGCSVEMSTLQNRGMIDDINKYSYIVVREKLSYNIFDSCVSDKSKILKVCDPAFHLPIKETPLPNNFANKNTLGINFSPVMFADVNDPDDIMYQNAYTLMNYVLAETDMHICLIPHVYNIEKNAQDIKVLRNIYQRYAENDRVSLVDQELSCTELKYIISKCRFFIGARTHATIAAYSTEVPCIALSYSIKSRGIAMDLFGTDQGYAVPYKSITEPDVIQKVFLDVLNHEDEILAQYKAVLPAYKQSIIDATRKIMESD